MGKLAEYLKTEAENVRREETQRKEAIAEWRQSLDPLFRELRKWLSESDPEQLLNIRPGERTIREGRLGEYQAPFLAVTLGNQTATVTPRARHAVGVVRVDGTEQRISGLAEIRGDDEMALYYLYRVSTGGGDQWYIRPAAGHFSDPDRGTAPLDRERFEAAILDALR